MLTVKTWMPPVNLASMRTLISDLFPRWCLLFLAPWLLEYLLCLFSSKRAGAIARSRQTVLAPVAGLVLMLLFLIVYTRVAFSIMSSRYAFVAVLALGPGAAFLVSRIPFLYRLAFLIFLIKTSSIDLQNDATNYRWQDKGIQGLITSLHALPADASIIYSIPHVVMVVDRYAPDLASRGLILDFEREDFPKIEGSIIFCRDYMRNYQRLFGAPKLIPWRELRELPAFYLIPEASLSPAAPSQEHLEEQFPAYDFTYLGNGLFRCDKKSQLVAPTR